MKIEDITTSIRRKKHGGDYVEEILFNIEESAWAKDKYKLMRNMNEFTRITNDYKEALGQDNLTIYLSKLLEIAVKISLNKK